MSPNLKSLVSWQDACARAAPLGGFAGNIAQSLALGAASHALGAGSQQHCLRSPSARSARAACTHGSASCTTQGLQPGSPPPLLASPRTMGPNCNQSRAGTGGCRRRSCRCQRPRRRAATTATRSRQTWQTPRRPPTPAPATPAMWRPVRSRAACRAMPWPAAGVDVHRIQLLRTARISVQLCSDSCLAASEAGGAMTHALPIRPGTACREVHQGQGQRLHAFSSKDKLALSAKCT